MGCWPRQPLTNAQVASTYEIDYFATYRKVHVITVSFHAIWHIEHTLTKFWSNRHDSHTVSTAPTSFYQNKSEDIVLEYSVPEVLHHGSSYESLVRLFCCCICTRPLDPNKCTEQAKTRCVERWNFSRKTGKHSFVAHNRVYLGMQQKQPIQDTAKLRVWPINPLLPRIDKYII